MRNSDKWVRWNDRDDLQERFAIVTEARRWGTVDITLAEYIFSIGKIPDELIDEICEHIKSEAPFQKGKVIHINIQPLKDMTDDYQIKAIRERHERNNYNCYWAGVIRKAVSDIEYHYEAQYELAAAGAAQPSTVDADAEQTDPAAQTPAAGKQTGKKPSQKPRAGSGGRKQNNFKLPAGDAGINTLLDILRYLRDRKTQKWIAGKIGFDESNWNKEGTLGECLRKLKQRAEQYPNKEDSDWLACAALSKGLNEAELDLDKDINRREVPMGVMNDRDQWEK